MEIENHIQSKNQFYCVGRSRLGLFLKNCFVQLVTITLLNKIFKNSRSHQSICYVIYSPFIQSINNWNVRLQPLDILISKNWLEVIIFFFILYDQVKLINWSHEVKIFSNSNVVFSIYFTNRSVYNLHFNKTDE